ncbi:hypothetical protein EHM76_06925 [bacterium]|nr:MAG: hypothetical protein EHM76_06925 [bacterium]
MRREKAEIGDCPRFPPKTYTVTHPLHSRLYGGILDYAVGKSATFLLVVRDSLGLSARATGLLERLRDFLVKDYRSSRWPGTELIKGSARLLEYTYTCESKDILKHVTKGLYDWKQPDLPEDLCLLRASGDVWMATISHERDAFFEMGTEELRTMLRHIPDLGNYVKEEGESADTI